MLPFTHDQFLDVFGIYNREFGGIALVLWLLTVASVSLLWKRGARVSRLVATVLVIHWTWTALGYHLALFRRVNPAALWFAVLFLVQAGILLWQGVVRGRLTFVPSGSPRGIAGAVLIAYALLYPGLGPLFGLSYPRVPSFGVPCPLSLLTIGLLLMASPRQAGFASVIPLIWTGIAGSAAFLLGIRADLALLPAGAALILHQVGSFRGGRRRWTPLFFPLLFVGCASAPLPPLTVSGEPASVAALSGHWTGNYRLSDWARQGIVTFDLEPGDTLAAGSVLLQSPSPATAAEGVSHVGQAQPAGLELSVKFVHVEDGMVRGQLDPYIDPDWACPVLTVFIGRQEGDRIHGIFTICNTINGDTRTGTWSVERKH